MTTHSSNPEDYDRIAQAIAFMQQNYLNAPDLATVAQQVNLSEYHFQRIFVQWVGISPKRFWQYLTVEYAKTKMAETRNLLDLALNSGLSGSGRLHDLFVKLEALSPGEFKAGGRGLTIGYGLHDTPLGRVLLAQTPRGICNFYLLGSIGEEAAGQFLREEWPNAEIRCDRATTQAMIAQIFHRDRFHQDKPLSLLVKGTNFQIQVWRALLRIPFGGLTSYQTIAQAIGRPRAARAVGNAVGRNPISYLIPCHRVLRESGALGGYRWGCDRKALILGWEAGLEGLETKPLRFPDGDQQSEIVV
ncbi:methylated-DNA--[protein]-cysteine S-methyltransferase [Spirulina sp. 06S082]|uniref:bifunctional helix-turn-helix domain-containing protein/methylated-DNA--[protein]-cysteine S-methyltransferase n=1 Tax=Spirulina sp. 06S082 TaxID=3110248 RepID=UPI002B1FD5C5|nr:methylated-DNA--[protein]-cysteine S-methyltransferase [Spirulina sp. 06S082]MEA5471239.1 methylated-DNA--[protein]-cysteine S-methyltransferase [Spirulina sp. 06S082]